MVRAPGRVPSRPRGTQTATPSRERGARGDRLDTGRRPASGNAQFRWVRDVATDFFGRRECDPDSLLFPTLGACQTSPNLSPRSRCTMPPRRLSRVAFADIAVETPPRRRQPRAPRAAQPQPSARNHRRHLSDPIAAASGTPSLHGGHPRPWNRPPLAVHASHSTRRRTTGAS